MISQMLPPEELPQTETITPKAVHAAVSRARLPSCVPEELGVKVLGYLRGSIISIIVSIRVLDV